MVWRPPDGWRSATRQLLRGGLGFLRLPPSEWATTLHVVVVISLVEVLIRPVPTQRLARMFGVRLDLTPAPPGAARLRQRELSARARRQLRCTRRVTRAWPFSNGPCLRQSLVAGHLLRRQSPVLRLGVAGSGDELFAHAWLEMAGRPLEDVDGLIPFVSPSGGAAT